MKNRDAVEKQRLQNRTGGFHRWVFIHLLMVLTYARSAGMRPSIPSQVLWRVALPRLAPLSGS